MNRRNLNITAPHFLFKIQSERLVRKTEDQNFKGVKSITQWWYFDVMLDDGSLLVFLFTPFQWWSAFEKMPTNKSFVYVSYLKPTGELFTASQAFDVADVRYTDTRIESLYFTLERAHQNKQRQYTATFNLDDAKGTVTIASDADAFSPFPGGAMPPWAGKSLLKLKSKSPLFRYAAHVPNGKAKCELTVGGARVDHSGSAYHEQGMFRGLPHEMVPMWSWFHFASKSYNVFGTPEEFFCLETHGAKVIGGFTLFDKGCVLSDVRYDTQHEHLLIGGVLSFDSGKRSFRIAPADKCTPMIAIPSVDTTQLWGTVAQPSTIRYIENGNAVEETGWLLLETCRMGK